MHNTLLFERLLILSIDKFEKLFMRSFKSEILHIKAEWKLDDTTVWFASERVRATPLHWHQNWGKMWNQLHSYSIFGCCWTITTLEPMLSIFDLLCLIISVRRCQSVCLNLFRKPHTTPQKTDDRKSNNATLSMPITVDIFHIPQNFIFFSSIAFFPLSWSVRQNS